MPGAPQALGLFAAAWPTLTQVEELLPKRDKGDQGPRLGTV